MKSMISFLEQIAPWYRYYGAPTMESLATFITDIGKLSAINSTVDGMGSVVSTLPIPLMQSLSAMKQS